MKNSVSMKTTIFAFVITFGASFAATAQEPIAMSTKIVKTDKVKHSRGTTPVKKKVDLTNKKKIANVQKIEAVPVEELKTK